jgi:hypothetical protein
MTSPCSKISLLSPQISEYRYRRKCLYCRSFRQKWRDFGRLCVTGNILGNVPLTPLLRKAFSLSLEYEKPSVLQSFTGGSLLDFTFPYQYQHALIESRRESLRFCASECLFPIEPRLESAVVGVKWTAPCGGLSQGSRTWKWSLRLYTRRTMWHVSLN